MEVQIVMFPETRVAAIEHHGPPALEHNTVQKLIAWKIENRLLDLLEYRSYGVHHTDPRTTPPSGLQSIYLKPGCRKAVNCPVQIGTPLHPAISRSFFTTSMSGQTFTKRK
jgi:hypothetical protein